MNNLDQAAINEKVFSTDDILEFLWVLLTIPNPVNDIRLSEKYRGDEAFQKITDYLLDLRELSNALSRGDLEKLVYSKGYILSNLKALQSNLRHMTWQTEKIAEGDFSQKIDFLGKFSESFNKMTEELQNFSERLTTQATVDQLTQLPNRHFLMPFLSKCFERFLRDREDFTVMIVDIDHFKKVNDRYGHDAGDKVLADLSRLLNAKFRSSDVFTRYGGEEFLAVLINTNIEAAKIVAERVRKAAGDTPIYLSDDVSISITVSVGISQTESSDLHFDSIIKRSDTALYTAKSNGRNQVVAM